MKNKTKIECYPNDCVSNRDGHCLQGLKRKKYQRCKYKFYPIDYGRGVTWHL